MFNAVTTTAIVFSIFLRTTTSVLLQELQLHCTEGQALLNTLLVSRELVIPWGLPQIEDRALETMQQEWRLYQARLADTRAQLNSALAKLRQMEQKFQRLDSWLKGMETKAQLRSNRRSDRATKDAQLQLIKVSVTCPEALPKHASVRVVSMLCQLLYLHFKSMWVPSVSSESKEESCNS